METPSRPIYGWIFRRYKGNMIQLYIIIFFVILSLAALIVLFYFLNKRQQNIEVEIQKFFEENTNNINKMESDIKLLHDNMAILRDNDQILSDDLEKLVSGYRGIKKKIAKES